MPVELQPHRATANRRDEERGRQRSRYASGRKEERSSSRSRSRSRHRHRRRRSSRSQNEDMASLLLDRVFIAKNASTMAEAKVTAEKKKREKTEEDNAELLKKLERAQRRASDYKKLEADKADLKATLSTTKKKLATTESSVLTLKEEKEETVKELIRIKNERNLLVLAKKLNDNLRVKVKQELRTFKISNWNLESQGVPVILEDSTDEEEQGASKAEADDNQPEADYGGPKSASGKESSDSESSSGSESDDKEAPTPTAPPARKNMVYTAVKSAPPVPPPSLIRS